MPPMSATGWRRWRAARPACRPNTLNLNRDYDVLRKNYEELLARRE